jgi:hypothetical protein
VEAVLRLALAFQHIEDPAIRHPLLLPLAVGAGERVLLLRLPIISWGFAKPIASTT